MTFDPKPLLKGLGATADVAGQIATDKAVNSRRTRSDFFQFDITGGQLLEDVTSSAESAIPHSLKRVPKGAIVLKCADDAWCVDVSSSAIVVNLASTTMTVWVV